MYVVAPNRTDLMGNLAIGRNNRRQADSLGGFHVRPVCEAIGENLRSGTHGVRISGIKGGNTPGVFILLEPLAVAEAKAERGRGQSLRAA